MLEKSKALKSIPKSAGEGEGEGEAPEADPCLGLLLLDSFFSSAQKNIKIFYV